MNAFWGKIYLSYTAIWKWALKWSLNTQNMRKILCRMKRTDFTNVYFMLLLRTLSNNFANSTWYGSNNYRHYNIPACHIGPVVIHVIMSVSTFIITIILYLYHDCFSPSGQVSADKVQYCERFIELLIDIEAQLPTRRFFNVLLDDSHCVVKCQLSDLVKRKEGKLFSEVYWLIYCL